MEILETPLSPIRASLIPTICAFVTVALAWAFIGKVDIIASAQGKIQTVGRTKTIQPLETSKVLALAVENGQTVKAGQLLLELDPSEAKADEATLTRDIRALKAEAVRRSVAIESARTRQPPPTAVNRLGRRYARRHSATREPRARWRSVATRRRRRQP